MTLISSSLAPLPGEADVLPDLMTGERLVGTGRFFAAFCVAFGTGILLMRECMILPSLPGERYRFTRHGRSVSEGGLRLDPLALTTFADVGDRGPRDYPPGARAEGHRHGSRRSSRER